MRKLIIGIYVLYVLIITYLSLTPIEHKVSEGLSDKSSHFIAYLVFFIIVKKVHTKSNYLRCAIICFIYSFIL